MAFCFKGSGTLLSSTRTNLFVSRSGNFNQKGMLSVNSIASSSYMGRGSTDPPYSTLAYQVEYHASFSILRIQWTIGGMFPSQRRFSSFGDSSKAKVVWWYCSRAYLCFGAFQWYLKKYRWSLYITFNAIQVPHHHLLSWNWSLSSDLSPRCGQMWPDWY